MSVWGNNLIFTMVIVAEALGGLTKTFSQKIFGFIP